MISLYSYQNKDSVMFTAVERDFNRHNFSLEVSLTKLFKHLVLSGSQQEDYQEDIMSHLNRSSYLLQALSRYVRRNFQIGEIEKDVFASPAHSALFRQSRGSQGSV